MFSTCTVCAYLTKFQEASNILYGLGLNMHISHVNIIVDDIICYMYLDNNMFGER